MNRIYLNFPVSLLRQAFINIREMCSNIMDYAIYKHSLSLSGDQKKQVKDSADFFKIRLGTIKSTIENGKLIMDHNKNTAMTGISHTMLFDFYENEKNESEVAVLLAFLAIKSILGKKSYCRIHSEFLLCRMAGYNSKKEMSSLPDNLKKYLKRYHMDCLKYELKCSFGLKIYGRYTRGFFVSFELTEEQLIRVVELKRKKHIEIIQKQRQNRTVEKVLREIYSTNDGSTTRQHL